MPPATAAPAAATAPAAADAHPDLISFDDASAGPPTPTGASSEVQLVELAEAGSSVQHTTAAERESEEAATLLSHVQGPASHGEAVMPR